MLVRRRRSPSQILLGNIGNVNVDINTNIVKTKQRYLDLITELQSYQIKKPKEYDTIIEFLNKAEFILDANLIDLKLSFLNQKAVIMKRKREALHARLNKQLAESNNNVVHNGNVVQNTSVENLPLRIVIPAHYDQPEDDFDYANNNRRYNYLEDIANYDLDDTMREVMYHANNQQNFITTTARPIDIIDNQNVHDSSINDKVKKDYQIIKNHRMSFDEKAYFADLEKSCTDSKKYKVKIATEKIKQRDQYVVGLDKEYAILQNCYMKMKSIKADLSILYENIYNCDRDYFVCPTGVAANLVSSFAFLLNDVGILKTVPVIRQEIFNKVSVLKNPTKQKIDKIIDEYKDDLRESDLKLVTNECYIGADLI